MSVAIAHIRNRARDLDNYTLFGQRDTRIVAGFRPWAGGEPMLEGLTFRAGLKLPTGRTESDLNPNEGPATLLQLGTGTLDAILGVEYRVNIRELSLFTRTHIQGALHRNRHGFRPSDFVAFETGAAYRFLDMFVASLTLSGVVLNKDRIDGDSVNRSGGSAVFVTPSFSADVGAGFNLYASVRVPVYLNSHYPPNAPRFVLGARWTIRF